MTLAASTPAGNCQQQVTYKGTFHHFRLGIGALVPFRYCSRQSKAARLVIGCYFLVIFPQQTATTGPLRHKLASFFQPPRFCFLSVHCAHVHTEIFIVTPFSVPTPPFFFNFLRRRYPGFTRGRCYSPSLPGIVTWPFRLTSSTTRKFIMAEAENFEEDLFADL